MLGESFGLGEVWECRFLPIGLMNGNWRLGAGGGSFALKRIVGQRPESLHGLVRDEPAVLTAKQLVRRHLESVSVDDALDRSLSRGEIRSTRSPP
ncbi:hypothetical protein [Kitasatospora purpeofusca]|uniref:hypothetical protein n=1 Tax=Kitasatospora purpeofusca TaxID=67352 RepID=UPI0036971349